MKKSIVLGLIFTFNLLSASQALSLSKKDLAFIKKIQASSVQLDKLKQRDFALSRLEFSSDSEVRVAFNSNGTPAWLKGKLTGATVGNKVQIALAFLEEYKDLFLLQSPSSELRLKRISTDMTQNTHVRLEQVYQGLPVWGSQLIVHFHKDGYIKSINGEYEPTPELNVTPVLDRETSLKIAQENLSYREFRKEPTAELIIFPWENETYLAWLVTLVPDLTKNWKYFVNASTGSIILKYNDVKHDGPILARGVDVQNNMQFLNAYSKGDTIGLLDVSKPMFLPPVDSSKGVIVTLDAMNNWDLSQAELVIDPNNDTVFNDTIALRAAVSAHFNLGLIYDYFLSNFQRNSWDDYGSSIIGLVHFGVDYDNAFWSPAESLLVFGDGYGTAFLPFSGALDVVAHEFGHAMTDATVGLIYLGEWGALNEHISDVWGAMLDSNDWLIGEDIYTPGAYGDAIRDMANPSSPKVLIRQPSDINQWLYLPINEDFDNGGVHINSGIPNRAAYLLASQTSREIVNQLYYHSLVDYLVPKSKFVDLRYALIQSAEDLYLYETDYWHIHSSITNSFDAVGISDFYIRGTDNYAYDDGNAEYYAYVGPFQGYNLTWAVRFTPHVPCSLLSVTTQFFTKGSDSYLTIWDDSNGVPGRVVLSSNVDRTVSYPSWQNINISDSKLYFENDFYVGFRSATLDSFLLLDFLQAPNHFTLYLDTLSSGNWLLFFPQDSLSDPLIHATVKYTRDPALECGFVAGDANGDGLIKFTDVVRIINLLFRNSPKLNPSCAGDANNSGLVTLADAIYLINFLFKSGPRPVKGWVCCL